METENNHHEPSDADLVGRVRGGDEDAFADLVDRYKDPLVGYLTRLAGCRDRAEDLAQETFVRFYRKLDAYREQGELKAYLYRIASNLLRSEERRKQRWNFLRPIFQTQTRASEDPPVAAALAREEQREVARALARIDLTFRETLVLREIEELSYGEIAEILGISEGTVKSRLHRGRELMKQHLTPYWTSGAQTGAALA